MRWRLKTRVQLLPGLPYRRWASSKAADVEELVLVTPSDLGASRRRQGIEFESCAIEALKRHGFELKRKGEEGSVGADDGVDLCGTWNLAVGKQVLVQCKSLSRTVPVSAIREFEATVLKANQGNQERELAALGVIASSTELSRPAMKWLRGSQVPLVVAMVLDSEEDVTFAMNDAMARLLPDARMVRQFDPLFGRHLDLILYFPDSSKGE